ncbi:A/G-specific adenine glycosylase [Ornithobacterium rhinotracheale]|uniref:A/G-specific adenine glycosylase n=1 Tax=Ornithobacterium rhinotracheale TaxID=28251 RepID=UPI00129C68BB|nr:A/G-specific adenine glycosylase [Ornithobacterium rhinotracheale]MRI63703.1 A/G-specific adenine glycosylase [Ornithobacterium rhinotracheale]
MNFAQALLLWYDQNKRELPWRDAPSPYHIWISEIILQQTRVNQGMDYYLRFVERFPTPTALAHADEQEVLNLWKGLGYYSRARNIHKAAKMIVSEFGGELPSDFQTLQKLPGIGKYTAAAIASIAFGEPVAAIDGNAFRVYSRFLGMYDDIAEGKSFAKFFEAGQNLICHKRPGDFNQAVMELGATMCFPQNPTCMFCPVQDACYAFNHGKIGELPVKTKKVKIKEEKIEYLYVFSDEFVLMHHRNKQGIWKNMYDFPTKELMGTAINLKNLVPQESVLHILTHKRLNIDFFKLKLNDTELKNLSEEFSLSLVPKEQTKDLPTPKPITDFLKNHANSEF